MSWTQRTEMLLGNAGAARLSSSCIVVAGLGGVGAYAAEMVVRAGIGHIVMIDSDTVSETNINRQLPALHSTIGLPKVDVMESRLKDINPDLVVDVEPVYLTEETIPEVLGRYRPDFVIDAIDTLSPKIALIQYCLGAGVPLVSSMGSGAKKDATKVRIADISKTYQCPLAHMLRKRLHKLGIREGFLAVFSEELPDRGSLVLEESVNKKSQVGTVSYLPAVFGCVCAQAAIERIADVRSND